MKNKRSHSDMMMSRTPTLVPCTTNTRNHMDHHLYVVLAWINSGHSYSIHKINLNDLSLRFETSSPQQRRKDNESMTLPEPLLKLPSSVFPCNMGFFAVGSRIYMFGGGGRGSRICRFGGGDDKFTSRPSTACYVYETCPKSPDYKFVKETPRLRRNKLSPIVLGPLHGKYYVISHSLAFRDLEEFNPDTECWTPLPQPPSIDPHRRHKDGSSSSFNDSSSPRRDSDCYYSREHMRLTYQIEQHSIAGNKLLFLTAERVIYTYDVVTGTWDLMLCSFFGRGKYPPPPRAAVSFEFFSYAKFKGPQFVQVCDEKKKSGISAVVYNHRVSGMTGTNRDVVKNAMKHHIVSLEGTGKLCMVSSLADVAHFFYVSVDLCTFSGTGKKLGGSEEDGDVPSIVKHQYATYSIQDFLERIDDIAACFLSTS